MKHEKTPTPVGAAGRWTLVAVTLFGILGGSRLAEAAGEKEPPQPPTPSSGARPELFTNVYVVPPTFLHHHGDRGYLPPPSDPFATPADPDQESGPQSRRYSARDLLESYGVSFGEGTSAAYNPQTSQVIVRQTQDQMTLVEAVIESMRDSVQHFVHLQYRIVESPERLLNPSGEFAEATQDPTIDRDSGVRRVGEKTVPASPVPTLTLEAQSIFTESQLDTFLDQIRESRRGRVRRSASLLSRSGERGEMWVADALTEVDPVIGGDNASIDLNLNVKTGRPDTEPSASIPRQITLWSGQTVALEENLSDGSYRTRLVTATIVDPAGLPLDDPGPDLQARTYHVPAFPTHDPTNREVHDVRSVLEKSGIVLVGEGARAFYNPHNHRLFVRGTRDRLAQIETLAGDWQQHPEWPDKQIYFTIREVILEGVDAHLDWMVALGAGPEPPTSLPRIAGVFTDPQLQVMIRFLNNQKGVQISSPSSVLADSGVPGATRVGDREWGVLGLIGTDAYTIHVKFAAGRPGEIHWPERLKDDQTPGVAVTLWEGQTIAYAEAADQEGKTRITFITANLVETAGATVVAEQPAPTGQAVAALTPDEQEAVQKADESALRGSQLLADGEFAGAVEKFEESLRLLPEHSTTEDRRNAYQKQCDSARKRMLGERKGEPDRRELPTTPSLFPESEPEQKGHHASFEIASDERLVTHDVFARETLFGIAKRYGVSVKRLRLVNRMTNDVIGIGDRLIVPVKIQPNGQALELPTWDRSESFLKQKARKIVIPQVEFTNTPLGAAVDFLREKSVEYDDDSSPGKRGLVLELEVDEETAKRPVSLRLSNVTISEVLHYLGALAELDIEYGDEAISLSGMTSFEHLLVTSIEPKDLWFVAYSKLRDGEQAEDEKNYGEAWHQYLKASRLFSAISEKHPEFHPELVKYRLQQLRKKLDSHPEWRGDQ